MPQCEICGLRKVSYFYTLKSFTYYFCPRCKTLLISPIPSKKEITKYYTKSFAYNAGVANEKNIRERARLILKKILKLNPHGKKLLDIGSGFAYFLDEAKNYGLETTGIEPSKHLISVSMYQYIDTIYNLTFDSFYSRYNNKKFDFVTLIHTIEHVLNPTQTVEKASRLLKPGGILYIETPNLDSHLFHTEKYDYTFLTPPDHIWIFSQKSFRYILKNNSSIKIESLSTYSYPEHFMGIIKAKFQNPKSKSKTNTKFQNLNYQNGVWKLGFGNWKLLKYLLFDKLLAPFFTPVLNLGNKGSILELYIKKK